LISFRVSLFLLALSAFAVFAACLAKERRPCKYLIPEGYVGWVRIDYKIKGAPALPIDDGRRILKFPPIGHLETSSEIEYGAAGDEYYYYSDDELRPLAVTDWDGGGMIWAHSNGRSFDSKNEETSTHEHFFVGTEDEYRKYGADYGDHKIGPVKKPSPQ
jgi:hypothetical protein